MQASTHASTNTLRRSGIHGFPRPYFASSALLLQFCDQRALELMRNKALAPTLLFISHRRNHNIRQRKHPLHTLQHHSRESLIRSSRSLLKAPADAVYQPHPPQFFVVLRFADADQATLPIQCYLPTRKPCSDRSAEEGMKLFAIACPRRWHAGLCVQMLSVECCCVRL